MLELFYDRKQKEFTPPLQQIFLKITGKVPSSLNEARAMSQDYFLRPNGYDRHDLRDTLSHFLQRRRFRCLFRQLGLVDALLPKRDHYDQVIIFGSDAKALLHRIRFFQSLSCTYDRVILLTGERILHPQEIHFLAKRHIVLTNQDEIEMARSLWPCQIPYTCLAATKKKGNPRAITRDAVAHWINKEETQGHHLLISHQPFAFYQYLVTTNLAYRSSLNAAFDIAAPARFTNQGEVAVTLDTIARILFEI